MKEELEEKPIYDEDALNDQDTTPWFGVQLYGLKQKDLSDYLEEKSIKTFVPMQNVVFIDRNGRRRNELRPVVSNLIFIKMTINGKEIQRIIDERYKGHFYIIRKVRQSTDFYQIP